MARILVADDEPSIREALEVSLGHEGHSVTAVGDGLEAWQALERDPGIELAILDIVMPALEGTAVLSRLRLSGRLTPVIMLSSRDEELDRLGGFALGADDYIGKPFSLRELAARVQAVLRRTPLPQASLPPAGSTDPLVIKEVEHRAFYEGKELVLTLIEFRLLQALCTHRGAALTREQLIGLAWPPESWIEDRLVDSHIKRLRKKLEAAGAPDTLIGTIYGLGYRMENLP